MSDEEIARAVESVMPYIHKCANREAALHEVDRDDIVQACMVAVVRCARQYDPATGNPFFAYASITIRWIAQREARRIASPLSVPRSKAHLSRLTRCSIEQRDEDRAETNASGMLDSMLRDETSPADVAMDAECRRVIDQALDRLPANQREAVKCYFLRGLTQAEAGKALGMTGSRVGQLIASALPRLRRNRALQECAA